MGRGVRVMAGCRLVIGDGWGVRGAGRPWCLLGRREGWGIWGSICLRGEDWGKRGKTCLPGRGEGWGVRGKTCLPGIGEQLIIVTGATFFFNFNFLFAKTFIQSRAGFISLILNCLGKF